MELLADILVKENLLVPEKEFLDSFEKGDGVSKQLLMIWAEFIHIIDKMVEVLMLVEK